jgi:RNA-binding protein YlmH
MYIGREFSTLSNSIWYTLITMTTVGYGDVVVNTPVGRFIAILMIFTGAYLTALLIAVQSNLLSLRESGKSAIVQSTEQKSALDLIVAGLRL